MNTSIAWLKSNVFTVIFALVMIAALVALPLVAARMNRFVKDTVKKRLDRLRDLEALEATEVTWMVPGRPAVSEKVLVNDQLLRRYRAVTREEAAEAGQVYALALEHNRRERDVLLPRLFPTPPPTEAQVLPRQFHSLLVQAYDSLLQRVDAGLPPAAEELREKLELRKARFYSQRLQKDLTATLEPHEQQQLIDELMTARCNEYRAAAELIGVYASSGVLHVPEWDQAREPSLAELFEWQWRLWICEDVLTALSEANESGTVLRDPVKRVRELWIWPEADLAAAGAGAAQEIKPDYGASFTGRRSNALYDVRLVRLVVVAETARLPLVLDALARRNFMTVLDMEVSPADPFADAKTGYLYGDVPVVEVAFELETIWMREWTARFMPEEVKAARGIGAAGAGGAVAPANPGLIEPDGFDGMDG